MKFTILDIAENVVDSFDDEHEARPALETIVLRPPLQLTATRC
jgi:hypothetical protein